MNSLNPALEAEIVVSACISSTAMPARLIAALTPGDVLETEPAVGSQPTVRLKIGATIVAIASIAKVDGRLVATILDYGPALAGTKDDLWKVRKQNQATA